MGVSLLHPEGTGHTLFGIFYSSYWYWQQFNLFMVTSIIVFKVFFWMVCLSRSNILLILKWFGHVFPAQQFLSVCSLLIVTRTWYSGFCLLFEVTPRFFMWHWPIRIHLDLSFICSHHHVHLVDDQSTSHLLHFLLSADKTKSGRHSALWLQFMAFSLDSIMSLSH